MAPNTTALRSEDLALVERQLVRATKAEEFGRVQAQLNKVERAALYSGSFVQAQFYLISAALKIKAVSLGQHRWLRPQPEEVLQEALLLLQKSQSACDDAVAEARGWTVRLSRFQQSCAYEACVATTHILSLGHQPQLVFDTSRLDSRQQRNYVNALRHRLRLRSSF